jgi:hypothetical protein
LALLVSEHNNEAGRWVISFVTTPSSMRFRRKLPVLFGFLIFVATVAAVVFLRKHAPPEPARLLPTADGFVYVDLKWMRHTDMASHLPAVAHDPEYEQFIQGTGFQFERDLQEAALAIHYASAQTGGETRFSEVFVARIDGDRLRAYLKKLASSVDTYRAIDVYNIPLENRILRVAILGSDTVAASNLNDPLVIRGIIDRSRKVASPFGGPALLRQSYKHVPLTSLAWAIFKLNSANPEPSALVLPFSGPAIPVASVVVSVRYVPVLGEVHLRAEAFTKNDQEAEQLTSQVNTFLAIFHSAEVSVSGQTPDPDLRKALDSLKVEQHKDRTVLTATLPAGLLRKMVAEAPAQLAPRGPAEPVR